ncbi:MAG: hypothetical protein U9N02_01835 [Campylobacterota bacterium]|nr:hypothetical protein [Campylobacterota bacterium]
MFSNLKKVLKLSLITSVFLGTQLLASTPTDNTNINEMSNPNNIPKLSASDTVENWSENVLTSMGLSSFGENNGIYTLFAQQGVSLKPIDPQYGDALINAYDKAMMKIQKQYIMNRFGDIAADKIKSSYINRSTDAKKIELPPASSPSFWGKIVLVLEKKLDVKEKELDTQLLEMGVHPDTLEKATPTKKKDLFRDKFIKDTIRKASGSMAGLIPIQTTISKGTDGNTVVGIVAVASTKTIQIAKDITYQRKSLVKGKGRDIPSLLPTSNKKFISTMGVRLAYDIDGSPAVISYGLASYRPDSGDDYINEELKSEAKSAAIANADAQIAEMVNGRMHAENIRKNGEETRKYVERELKLDSDTIEKTVKNIIKITQKNIKSSASVKLQGISTVKRWHFTTKDGVKFVGAVRVWKYSTLKAVKSFNKPEITKEIKKKNYNNFHQSSNIVNTMDDF